MKKSGRLSLAYCLFIACLVADPATAQQRLLPLPVGADAYRLWDKWPQQRLGARAYMRSTYDRSGRNESADASHFLFMKKEDQNVTLDVAGRGVLYFVRTNHWHGSPWHYIIDGKDNIVKETGTDDPVHAKKNLLSTNFIPAAAFPQPLNWTWEVTKGADLVWTPIGFTRSLQLAYSRTRYGTGYYIYHLYADSNRLSRPIRTWNSTQAPDKDILDLVSRAGTDIAPKNIHKKTGTLLLNKPALLVVDIKAVSSRIRALKFIVPADKAIELERIRLKITWDNRPQASVDAPLCLFFGAGTLYNRDQKEFLVKSFPATIRFDYVSNKAELACYFPMPFFRSARIELENIPESNTSIQYEIRYEADPVPVRQNAYFHASYKDMPVPEPGKDLQLLDTKGIEGAENWSGSFVGTSFIFSHSGNLKTLEGDPRFFFDDSQSPQAYGTGTEEWGGGGDYWGGLNMTLSFAGHPVGAREKTVAKNEKDLIQSAYRFLLADLMPFGRRAVLQLEHGGENFSSDHYETIAYWYGLPAASLVLSDSLDIGSAASEQQHAYFSPGASAPETIRSRYEWSIDSFPAVVWGMDIKTIPGYVIGKEIYPAHNEDGRSTNGISEFTLKLHPQNQGALLRRTLDYSFPNQKAEVFVSGTGNDIWQWAGTWYLAGSNTSVYSDPPGELDARNNVVQTSNRRFRDDEFLLPAYLTTGKRAIRVRIQPVPDTTPLYPGFSFPRKNAWSELRYNLYSYVLPDFTPAPQPKLFVK